MWRKRLPSFRNKPCLWRYVPLLRIREKELKRAITRSRPLGNQLDTCKSAVERALTRLADCARKLEEAQRALRNAETDLHKKKRADLAELETRVRCTSTSPSSLRQFSHSVVLSRFSCPTRPEVRTHNFRILACACRARDDDPLSKLSSLASKMVCPMQKLVRNTQQARVLEEILVRRCISGTSLDVATTDPSAQVFHDTDLKELTEWTALSFVWLRQM